MILVGYIIGDMKVRKVPIGFLPVLFFLPPNPQILKGVAIKLLCKCVVVHQSK